MADQKLTQLTALASLSADDLFYVVDDPAGAALSRKMAASVLDSRYLLPANNLSDLVNAATARGNLGLGTLAVLNSPLPIANGGSGQVTQQAAIDALTAVSGATDEHVLTKDTATGNAIFKVSGSGTTLPVADTQTIVKGSADATKTLRFEVDGFTAGATRVMTPPNADGTLAILGLAQTWTAIQSFQGGTNFQYGTGGDVPTDGIRIVKRHASIGGRSSVCIQGTNDDYWADNGTGIIFKNFSQGIDITTEVQFTTDIGFPAKTWLGGNVNSSQDALIVNAPEDGNVYLLAMRYATSPYPKLKISAPEFYVFTKASPAWGDGSDYTTYGTETLKITPDGAKLNVLDSGTDNQKDVFYFHRNSTGTPLAGFGSKLMFKLETSTNDDQDAASLTVQWNVATHASKVADIVAHAWHVGGSSEIWRGRAGSSPLFSVLGATPVARQAHIVDADGTLADITTKFNSLLAYLENFGFVATS